MSQLSCVSAVVKILQSEVPGEVSVMDIESCPPTLPSDQGPYIVVQDGAVKETRLSGGIGGAKQVTYPIDCHLFVYSGSIDENSAARFRALVDVTQSTLRNAHRLLNLGDSPNSYVLIFGENLDTLIFPWTEDSSGIFLYHAVISSSVVEMAQDSTTLVP